MAIQSINPATEEILQNFKSLSSDEITTKIQKAEQTFSNWKNDNYAERKVLMLNASQILIERKQHLAKIMTLEMGKTFKQAIAEVEKCSWVCKYYAENTEKILNKEIIETDASESFVQFDPLGIVLAVMPWNFPFWQVFRFAAPALMAGNVGLLKHASNVPQCGIEIENIFHAAGFPEGCFTNLLIESRQVKEVIDNPLVKAATLTGSEFAGQKVAEACGNKLKKTVMELGGSDPFIVLNDAEIDEAVNVGVAARLINNGQSCIAAKRFIIQKEVYDEFTSKFVDKMKSIKVGDPLQTETQLGPIAREDLLIEMDEQIKKSVQLGAKILTGGTRIVGRGFYYEPTVIANLKKGMPAYSEELFGPAASIILAEDEEDAIKIANDTPFGLGASLWTSDISKAKSLSHHIDSGAVFINGMVKSDPRLPFGGVKLSGYGRELSHYGIKEFVNIKSVWVK